MLLCLFVCLYGLSCVVGTQRQEEAVVDSDRI